MVTVGEVSQRILRDNDEKIILPAPEAASTIFVKKLCLEQKEFDLKYREAQEKYLAKRGEWRQGAQEVEAGVNEVLQQTSGRLFDLLKQQAIFLVSFIRNLQYDLDSTLQDLEQHEQQGCTARAEISLDIPEQFSHVNAWQPERERIFAGQSSGPGPQEQFLERFEPIR